MPHSWFLRLNYTIFDSKLRLQIRPVEQLIPMVKPFSFRHYLNMMYDHMQPN